MENNDLVIQLIHSIKGDLGAGETMTAAAQQAFDMGVSYAQTRRFDNSRYYHNYRFRLDDGETVMSTNFFNLFMSRSQTAAYMEAEQAVRQLTGDDNDVLFHLVRDQRFGINGVFKACLSPLEPQQLNHIDFVLIIACFCAGVMSQQ